MRLSAKTFAAMLAVLALAAFQSDSYAQSRGSSRSSSTSRQSSGSVSRPSSSSRSTQVSRPSSKSSDNKTVSARPSQDKQSAQRPSGNNASAVTRPDNAGRPKPDISPADRKPSTGKPSGNKPSGNVTTDRPSGTPPSARPSEKPKPPTGSVNRPSSDRPAPDRPVARPEHRPKPGTPKPDFKPGNHNKPMPVHRPQTRPDRVHPRDRDFMHFSKPSYHWANTPHYYGYRVRVLPVNAYRRVFGGITYYMYDNVWYRPYGGYYVVCRPPFGTTLAADLIADMAWTAIKISYYNTVANTYDTISENNAYIAQQNAVIAQNNATIAAQNQTIAQSQTRAQEAYGAANQLGLVQSYASASTSYYYQDGVFYTFGSDGQYYVIVPPAGALVESLPEDFDTVIMNGKEYFKVDDTIYQMTVSDGEPYFEVVGQMN